MDFAIHWPSLVTYALPEVSLAFPAAVVRYEITHDQIVVAYAQG